MKTTRMIGWILAAMLAAPAAHAQKGEPAKPEPAPAAAKSGALDGKVFKGKVTKKGSKKKGDEDVLTFKDGTVHSSACDQFGFKPSAYKMEGDSFSAECTNDKGAKMKWHGTVKGKTLKATADWSHEGDQPMSFVYVGTLQ